MPRLPAKHRLLPLIAGLVALALFLPGIDWGLPSRADDRFLFGGREPWTGEQIIELAGGFEAAEDRGADVDVNPLDRSSGLVVLNDTDEKRAEIVRRYRLQSHQPDEFINFAAIAGMGQRRDLDPKLYQYGGLWIYPIAGLLGAAHAVGYIELTGDLAFYLDRPEEFGKFYIVARLYSTVWGAIGAGLVFMLVRRLSESDLAGFCGAAAFAMLPVVVTAAHEAKPHLAGAVLLLWGVAKADDFIRTGRRWDAVWAGVLVGAASAMVVSMVVGFAILPVMGLLAWLRAPDALSGVEEGTVSPSGETVGPGRREARHCAIETTMACIAGVVVYCVTNPFVVWNLLFDRSVFASNIGNSTAMYGVRDLPAAIFNAAKLLALALGYWLTGLIALSFILAMLRFGVRQVVVPCRTLGLLLVAAAGAVGLYYVPLAAGKMPEYARFAIPIAAVAVVGTFALLRMLPRDVNEQRLVFLLPVFAAALGGVPYTVTFVVDSSHGDTRNEAAQRIEKLQRQGGRVLNLHNEPAPWSIPPFDLFEWTAKLRGEQNGRKVHVQTIPGEYVGADGDWLIRGRFSTPISWANKPILVLWLEGSAGEDRGVIIPLSPSAAPVPCGASSSSATCASPSSRSSSSRGPPTSSGPPPAPPPAPRRRSPPGGSAATCARPRGLPSGPSRCAWG